MLRDIQISYLSKDKESVKMTKRIVRAIEALNSKKTLFLIEQEKNDDSSDDDDDEDVDNNEDISSHMQSLNMEKLKSTPVKEVSDRRLVKRGSQTSGKGNSGSFKRRHSL